MCLRGAHACVCVYLWGVHARVCVCLCLCVCARMCGTGMCLCVACMFGKYEPPPCDHPCPPPKHMGPCQDLSCQTLASPGPAGNVALRTPLQTSCLLTIVLGRRKPALSVLAFCAPGRMPAPHTKATMCCVCRTHGTPAICRPRHKGRHPDFPPQGSAGLTHKSALCESPGIAAVSRNVPGQVLALSP